MEVWILGATGRSGRAIVSALAGTGVTPVPVGRDAARLASTFPSAARRVSADSLAAMAAEIQAQRAGRRREHRRLLQRYLGRDRPSLPAREPLRGSRQWRGAGAPAGRGCRAHPRSGPQARPRPAGRRPHAPPRTSARTLLRTRARGMGRRLRARGVATRRGCGEFTASTAAVVAVWLAKGRGQAGAHTPVAALGVDLVTAAGGELILD